mgnify:FL=1|tara:strand:- start:3133 stop:4119 length:987 start_codon:yes stop_codon:yes gene_type:complete
MDFSVIIPSRNRPVLLAKAIESVLLQDHHSIEVLVVNDGSEGDNAEKYAQMAEALAPKVRFIDLQWTATGHGSSYAMNMGVEQAQGRYICFLDDDDFWTDTEHLSRTFELISRCDDQAADVIYAEQRAVKGGREVSETLWLNNLLSSDIERDAIGDGAYQLSLEALLTRHAFAHFNTSVVRRSFFNRIGGLDNNLRYENDRDFYLRCIDQADCILFQPRVIGQHNVPDLARQDNLSTVVNDLQKYLYQTQLYDKSMLFAGNALMRQYARDGKADTLKRITRLLVGQGDFKRAGWYARQAVGVGGGLKWLAYTIWVSFRAMAIGAESAK